MFRLSDERQIWWYFVRMLLSPCFMTELILSVSERDEVIDTEDAIFVYSEWNNNHNNEINDGDINKTGIKTIGRYCLAN